MFLMLQIDDKYRDEVINPNNAERTGLLTTLEGRLRALLEKLPELRQSLSEKIYQGPQGAGRVKAMAAFFKQQSENELAMDKLNDKIMLYRRFLHRQGAALALDGTIIWGRTPPAQVLYDVELARQAMTRIAVRNGCFFLPNGEPLDTKHMGTSFSGPGYGIFVVSVEGNLHVSGHRVGMRHHSSLLAAAPVACAGELKVDNGVLRIITNKSGHYRPPSSHLVQILRYWAANGGLNLNSFQVKTVNPGSNALTPFPTGTAFLASEVIPILPAPAAAAAPRQAYDTPAASSGPRRAAYEKAATYATFNAQTPAAHGYSQPGPAKAPANVLPVIVEPGPGGPEYVIFNPNYGGHPSDPGYSRLG